jgi:hypothetical protein
MLDADTPRSVGYGSPRDDRFFTPRTAGRHSLSSNSANSDEWLSPRFETPRYGETPRSQFGGTPRSQTSEDGDYETPRTFENERVKVDRREVYPPVNRTGDSPRNPHLGAQGKSLDREGREGRDGRGDYAYSKESYGDGGGGGGYVHAHNQGHNQSPGPSGRRAESKEEGGSTGSTRYGSTRNGAGHGDHGGHGDKDGSAYVQSAQSVYEQLDPVLPAGLSSGDVEDVFSYARHGRVEEIESLFTKGLPVDVRDAYGNTVLVIACQNGNKRVAKGVLRRGANINARNFKGNTPLHYCYHYGYGESLGQYLVSKGADADARNNAGRTIMQGI